MSIDIVIGRLVLLPCYYHVTTLLLYCYYPNAALVGHRGGVVGCGRQVH